MSIISWGMLGFSPLSYSLATVTGKYQILEVSNHWSYVEIRSKLQHFSWFFLKAHHWSPKICCNIRGRPSNEANVTLTVQTGKAIYAAKTAILGPKSSPVDGSFFVTRKSSTKEKSPLNLNRFPPEKITCFRYMLTFISVVCSLMHLFFGSSTEHVR